MLGRKTYEPAELDAATGAMRAQLAAYDALATAVEASGDGAAKDALAAFEPLFFNNLALALDRRFVHRLRSVTGKNGTPLNETELVVSSLLDNDGVLETGNVIKYKPEEAVLELRPGDRIALRADAFKRLSDGVLEEIREKYVNGR